MFNKIKIATLSALVGLGTLAAIPASAQEGLYLNLGQGGVYVQGGPRYDDRYDNRYDRGRYDDRRYDDRRWDRRCTPDRALDKAERMGLRRARIADVDRRTITVSGRKYGERVAVTFARSPSCPVIGW
ncbi:MAG: hypothetical protein ABS58_01340 [Mesorhizobium sp. SCN 65-20]|nr:MAG: hypothetical protein ABS58_01340 [Mesorhizobium sp. SCN 65-20]